MKAAGEQQGKSGVVSGVIDGSWFCFGFCFGKGEIAQKRESRVQGRGKGTCLKSVLGWSL